MKIGVPRETFPGERRVALVPASIAPLIKSGVEVVIETGAGTAAGHTDDAYREKGAAIADRAAVFAADIVAQVRSFGANRTAGAADLQLMRSGQVVMGMCDPLGEPAAAQQIAAKGVSLFALELIPRITRAQSMDVLSSMATVAGYKAVLLAANHLPKMFPMLMTAAGTLSPAKVFVIGAGVAGLQAIASARRLGAVVQAYDVRPAVKEQIESLGAKFVEMPLAAAGAEGAGGYAKQMDEEFYRRQRELMAQTVAASDVCISTAAIPGKPSPVLVTADAVRRMAPGSVIVDLAAERGGNCELTKADQTVVENGETIVGPTNLPSEVPTHASQMYAKNVTNFLALIIKGGQLNVNLEDQVVRETLATLGGEVVHPRLRELLNLPALRPSPPAAAPVPS
jgi:NAD(P) transhydrogenase subunit alpha